MQLRRQANDRGFTIIETLIVLAIAGIILMIVLLAIPTLERSSRNNQRKQDVQAILEAVSHYELNNSGNFLDCGHNEPQIPSCQGSRNLLAYSHITFYTDDSQVVVQLLNPNAVDPTGTMSDHDAVYVLNHRKCNAAGNGDTSQGAGYSDVVALYALETGSGFSWRCQQS